MDKGPGEEPERIKFPSKYKDDSKIQFGILFGCCIDQAKLSVSP
jgi:hypothetical protein